MSEGVEGIGNFLVSNLNWLSCCAGNFKTRRNFNILITSRLQLKRNEIKANAIKSRAQRAAKHWSLAWYGNCDCEKSSFELCEIACMPLIIVVVVSFRRLHRGNFKFAPSLNSLPALLQIAVNLMSFLDAFVRSKSLQRLHIRARMHDEKLMIEKGKNSSFPSFDVVGRLCISLSTNESCKKFSRNYWNEALRFANGN